MRCCNAFARNAAPATMLSISKLAKEEWSRPNSSSKDCKCITISAKLRPTVPLRNWPGRFPGVMLLLSPGPTNFCGAAKWRCAAGRIKAFQHCQLNRPNSENWRFEWAAKITNPGNTVTGKRVNAFTRSIKNISSGKHRSWQADELYHCAQNKQADKNSSSDDHKQDRKRCDDEQPVGWAGSPGNRRVGQQQLVVALV